MGKEKPAWATAIQKAAAAIEKPEGTRPELFGTGDVFVIEGVSGLWLLTELSAGVVTLVELAATSWPAAAATAVNKATARLRAEDMVQVAGDKVVKRVATGAQLQALVTAAYGG